MRMVIESITGVVTKSTANPVVLSVVTNLNGSSLAQYIFPTSTVANGPGMDSRFNLTTKLYTDAIYPLGISPIADYIYVVLNGYLVKK